LVVKCQILCIVVVKMFFLFVCSFCVKSFPKKSHGIKIFEKIFE